MSFGAIADDYDRLRPGPAAEAIDWLLPARCDVVVDLAAGTGLLTRALAGKAGHTIAIEPDDRMRSVLLARSTGVELLAGRGEAIPLPDARADAVLISSAWQWMDAHLAIREIARVLRDGGRFGVIWTSRDPAADWLRADDWFREANQARLDRAPSTAAAGEEAISDREHSHVPLPDPAVFGNIETTTFRFKRPMRVADVVDMLTTYSRVITASPAAREAGRARAAAALAQQFPGASAIEVPMRSRCWRADRVSRTGG